MKTLFANYAKLITREIVQILKTKAESLAKVNDWGHDVPERLSTYATRGKMLRGGLILLTHDLYNKTITDNAVKLASAIELFHSSLLIHDDIMDNDDFRRGEPALHTQYQQLLRNSIKSPENTFGKNMAICVGDIGFFLGMELITQLDVPAELTKTIMEVCSKEFSHVGIAQMQDVYFGKIDIIPTEAEISRLYKYKTARYTFSLPLQLGGLLISLNQHELNNLQSFGESLGILFQIKDDELGLLGDNNHFGKPVGSDIEEGKKTLFYTLLLQRISDGERQRLMSLTGSGKMTGDTIDFIRQLLRKHKIKATVGTLLSKQAEKSEKMIKMLCINESNKQLLKQFITYNLNRQK